MAISWDLHYVDYSTPAFPDRRIAVASFCEVGVAFQQYII